MKAIVRRCANGSSRCRQSNSKRIASIQTPTLFIWGGRDGLIPPLNARRFKDDTAGSELVMFEDLGHVPQEEAPSRVAAAIRAFLPQP